MAKCHTIRQMEEREHVEVLFLGNISHEGELQAQGSEKSSYQDEISFNDPVQIELIRIPNNGKEMYSRMSSQTQKQPIKSLEIYYRNLDKRAARYSLLVSSSSELLVSSSIDILIILRQTIFTDLLVIKGNFSNITFCIYGRVLQSKQQIQRKCPCFGNSSDIPLREQKPSITITRDIFTQSRAVVKAIEEEYSEAGEQRKVYNEEGFSNDRELYDSQINNICKLSQQLLAFDDLNLIQQKAVVQIRGKIEAIQAGLSKVSYLLLQLFKTARIGLYYPTPYRPSAIPEAIPTTIAKIAIRLLPWSLSDQYRALEVLKLILQLKPHAQYFVTLGGVQALVRLFLQFFSSDLVILSSLKCLIVQVFIALSFWDFSAKKMVEPNPLLFETLRPRTNSQAEDQEPPQEDSVSRSKSRSREKKKKKSQNSPSKSQEGDRKKNKKDKKSKKNKDKSKSRDRDRDRDRERQKDKKKDQEREKEKQRLKLKKQLSKDKVSPTKKQDKKSSPKLEEEAQNNNSLVECTSFYEIIFKIIRNEKNSKLQQLLRILVQQITQILTRNTEVSNQMAFYTPLLRDSKYMFSQGGEMINSKTLKTFVSFQPFLNEQQSVHVDSPYVCQSERIKHPKKYGISPKLFKLIDSALSILQSRVGDEVPLEFDEQFMTLMSALIENNKNGTAIGLSNFIEAIRVDRLLLLKKQEAIIAIICEYIHEVFIEDEGMNLIFYLDQIHNSMLKIIGWLKEDKTFSIEIKRKVQYLINSALIYNHFSGTENNFKSFSEYFIKLIGHENLDINKILEYNRKEYHKTVNPLSFVNISQSFALGNFYDVLPAQPLLEVDICLKVFLAILKLNKNIWTVFYQFKFVPAFATLFLKLHSLLKFFLSPSLQRHNAIIDLKMHDRLVSNYLQTAKHLTFIFIQKWKYESAFNQLTEEDQIYDAVELYEKWIDLYIVMENVLNQPGDFGVGDKTGEKIRELLGNFVELFDNIFKGYELTKSLDRQRNIKAIIKFIYRQHYESITFRSGILSILRLLVHLAGPTTLQTLSTTLFNPIPKTPQDPYNLMLPDNERSIFENILRKNIHRSDQHIARNLAALIEELALREQTRDRLFEILELVLDQHQAHLNQDVNDIGDNLWANEKLVLFVGLLGGVRAPMNGKIELHVLRLLKACLQQRGGLSGKQATEASKLKLTNSLIGFFKNALAVNPQFSTQLFQQYLKTVSPLLKIDPKPSNPQTRLLSLKTPLTILQSLISASSSTQFQSIMLYSEYIEKPSKPNCQFSLENILAFIRDRPKEMGDQMEGAMLGRIAICVGYLLCRLTTIDGKEFYSTQSRKNAIGWLVSPGRVGGLAEAVGVLEELVPKKIVETLKNYLDFPIVEKAQSFTQALSPSSSPSHNASEKESEEMRTPGSVYSKGVFTMISENDPVGRTRYELIQQRWQGGSTEGTIYKINQTRNYKNIVEQLICQKNLAIEEEVKLNTFGLEYTGVHPVSQVNNLFSFKIRKIFTQEAKKNAISANSSILMKAVPAELKRPELAKDYQSKMNTSPSMNRTMPATVPAGSPQGNMSSRPPYQPPPQPTGNNPMRASNSNNREPSPYTNPKPPVSSGSQPYYGGQNPPSYNPSSVPPTIPATTAPYYGMPAKNPPPVYNPVPPVSKTYPAYDPQPVHPGYDSGAYYPSGPYNPRPSYPPGYMVPAGGTGQPGYAPRMQPGMGYPGGGYMGGNPYPGRPVVQVRQAEEEMSNEAISILVYLQQNPNAPDKAQLKSRVNKLFEAPGVHTRVTRYFEDLKRG